MKKGFTIIELIGVIAILGIIIAIAVPSFIGVQKKNAEKAWTVQKNEIIKAAQAWGLEHINPDDNELFVTVNDLYNGGLLNSTSNNKIYNPVTKKSVMNYCVKIEKNDSNGYKYTFTKDCNPNGLANLLIKNNDAVGNSVGLIKSGDEYYFKGTNSDVSNNWVWWAGILWRVMSIDEDYNLTMISSGPLTNIDISNSAWNTLSEYEDSYVNIWMNSEGNDGVLYKQLSDSDKEKIVDSTFNMGNNSNVSSITTEQHFGLLDLTQYINAGMDGVTGKDSYLDIKNEFWLGNRNIRRDGSLNPYPYAYRCGVRPVVKISNLNIDNSSTGTISNPYRETSTSTNTFNIKIGEYISVPYTGTTKYCNEINNKKRCTFRVIKVDNNSIKITLNGLLQESVAFGNTSVYTANNIIDTYVKAFYNSIDVTYKYTGNDKKFGIGQHGSSIGQSFNYNIVNTSTITQNYGLPVVGELFTANDIEMRLNNTDPILFTDINTIENSNDVLFYFAMNQFDIQTVNSIDFFGGMNSRFYDDIGGVRPTLYLKKGTTTDLTFTSGDGTAEHPYMLGN